jgi:putative membrane protein
MKNQFSILTRFGIIGLTLGSLCFAGEAMAQTESKKKSDTAASAEVAATKESPKASSSLNEKDRMFIKKAAKGGTMEVEMGKLAAQNAKSDDVKSFGKRMETDHSKANDELKSIADKKGAKMPAKKPSVKWTSDKDYMDMMVKDHEKDLAEFQQQAKEGSDPDIKEFAEKTAKVIEEHLNLAMETQSKLK